MPLGFNGNILHVDLSKEEISVENPEEVFYRRYIGGMGFVGYYLIKEIPPKIDPLGPKNLLVFANGIVTGAPIQGSARNSVGAKSPLTGGFGEAEAGGFWGAELKNAGFDAIVITGRAKNPVFIWIKDLEVEIRNAEHLWGKFTDETHAQIRKELGDDSIRTALIGPGGEKMVRYASVMNDLRHAAGRTGMGAVMGSKNLKGIVVKATKKMQVANTKSLLELARWLNQNMNELSPHHKYGTGYQMDAFNEIGNLPVHNFRDGYFPNVDKITAQNLMKTYGIGMESCYACSVRCKKVVKTAKPYELNPSLGGPEYETLAAFGSNCGIDDLEAICKAHELCSKYSIDTISTGTTIAFAMECFENGLITAEDTDGFELKFGDSKPMLEMIHLIGNRKGFGSILAEGSKRAATKIGKNSDRFSIQVKGQEVPMHDPRLKKGLGLGYAVSPTGADHMHNMHDTGFKERDWGILKSIGILEPVAAENFGPGKVKLFTYFTNLRIANNCLLMCNFVPWSYDQITDIVGGVTGWNFSIFELMKVGERTTNLARIFNLREGFTHKDDWLPERFFEPTRLGALSNSSIRHSELEKAIKTYYSLMGWDEETGVPTEDKLDELDISYARF